MDSDYLLTCRFSLHNNQQISGFCTFPQCNNFRLFCVNCLLEYHCEHANECKKLNEYPQWAETFNQTNQENINKLESIQEIMGVFKSFKDWYETQYNPSTPQIGDNQGLNKQKYEQKINNLVNIKKIINIIDQSIKPQFEKLKIYLEYLMNQTGKINNLISYDEFIQSRLQTTSTLINRSQKNYDEAKSLYWSGKYQECINKCESFQKFHVTDIRFAQMKGDSYLELKDFQKAIENYNIAIEIDDTNYYAYGKIGDIMLNTEQLQEALKYYDECTKINNQLQEYYVKKAKIYQKWNQFQQSIECIDHVLSLNSSHIEALQMKATLLQLKNSQKDGTQQFQQKLLSSGAKIKQLILRQLKLRNLLENQSFLGKAQSQDEVNQQFQKAFNELEKNPAITFEICRENLGKDQTNFQFIMLSVYATINLGKYEEALNLCDLVKKVDPKNEDLESLQQIIYTLIQ